MPEWLKDPEGNEYRLVGSWKTGGVHVEYKTVEAREPDVPFRKFVVKFWNEEWHVSAPSAEAARDGFTSEFLLTGPRPEEVTVEEVKSANK